jgi:hypothetical protein
MATTHLMLELSDLQPTSSNCSPVRNVLPHDIFVGRRRHALFDWRWNSMPEQQLWIRSDAARRATVCWRRIRHGEALVVYLTHFRSVFSVVGWPKLMTLHRYGRRRNVVSRRTCGCGSDLRRVLMATMMSTPRCWFDPDDSLLVVPSTEAA